jgi:hypothetical protein
MKCIDTFFSKILSKEKSYLVEKEFIIPNEFDLGIIKNDVHYIKTIKIRGYYSDCNKINDIYRNYINIKIGDNNFFERGNNEILCFENDTEYMIYEIDFPTSLFFTEEKHILKLNELFDLYKIIISGLNFVNIDDILLKPTFCYNQIIFNLIFDHNSKYYQEGKFVCKSDSSTCYVNFAQYCPKWFKQNYDVCVYETPDIENYKNNLQEYIFNDNNDEKYILFFVKKSIHIPPLTLLMSHSLNNLFYTHLKNTYNTYMTGAFYTYKTKYYTKSYDFNIININYTIKEIKQYCDGLFKMKINNKLQQFNDINPTVDIRINHLDFFCNIDNINNEIYFDNMLLSDNIYITLTTNKIYEKYLDNLYIDLALICINNSEIKRAFLSNEMSLQLGGLKPALHL